MKNLSLYIHIPFCVRKCHYCDFLSAPCDDMTKQDYVDALCGEIIERAGSFCNKKVDTIFFGGGTPSVLSAEQMEQIMGTVRERFQVLPEAEITMEELYLGSNKVECLEGGDKRVALYPNEQNVHYKSGDILCKLKPTDKG